MKIEHKLPSPYKVLIGMPNQGEIKTQTMACLQALWKPERTEGTFTKGTLPHVARNAICQTAVNGGFTHIMFIDSDMVFPADTLQKLLSLHADVATAICYSRHKPYGPCIYSKVAPRGKNDKCGTAIVDERINEEKPFQTQGCGTAVCLIKTDIITWLWSKHQEPFDMLEGLGEDLSFCYKIKDRYKIMVEPSIKVGHIGEYMFTKEDYLREKENGIHG